MRVYQQRIYTSPRSGEVGRGGGRVGPVESQQIVSRSRESTLPGPENPTLPQGDRADFKLFDCMSLSSPSQLLGGSSVSEGRAYSSPEQGRTVNNPDCPSPRLGSTLPRESDS